MAIIKPEECVAQFNKLREPKFRAGRAVTTGFDFIDPTIKLALGYLMIVTGYPGSGKSEFVDAMLMNCALIHGWNTVYFSPENHPTEEHMAKIAERFIGKGMMHFTDQDSARAMEFMSKHFTWIYPDSPNLLELLRLTDLERKTRPVQVLVLDPWNNVSQNRGNELLHEYLSEALSQIIRFGRTRKIMIIVIAHPKNPAPKADGPIPHPNMWDISDGAMWRNKADYGVICHRPCMGSHGAEVYFQKIKYKWMGQIGMHYFDYEYATGRYKEKCLLTPEKKKFYIPGEIVPPF